MSWQQLKAIADERRTWAEHEATTPPLDCPLDGTLLVSGPSGKLGCTFCGYIWEA